MVANAAAAGIKNGCGQQMIQIDGHGAKQNHPSLQPTGPAEYPRQNPGEYQVQEIVNEGLHRRSANWE
jgi:hypothetical protein